MLQRRAVVLLSIFLLPLFGVGLTAPIGTASAAIDDCKGELSQIVENETISRHAEVPNNNNWWFVEDYEEDGPGKRQSKQKSDEGTYPFDPALSPEEEWMYQNYHSPSPVKTLTTNIATTMQIGNDSVGALRVNLSSEHRTTICVEIQGIVGDTTVPAKADVYLMTTSQYENYEWSYNRMHGDRFERWFERESISEDEFISEVPPEWAAFDVTGWKTYRDVHAYENTDSVVMSITMDGPEVYSSLFSDMTLSLIHI